MPFLSPQYYLIRGNVIRNLHVHLKGMFLQNDHLNAEKKKVLRKTNVLVLLAQPKNGRAPNIEF